MHTTETPPVSNDQPTAQRPAARLPVHRLGWPKHGSFSLWASDFKRFFPLYDLEPALRAIVIDTIEHIPMEVEVPLRVLFRKLTESTRPGEPTLPLTVEEHGEMLLRIGELLPNTFSARSMPANVDESRVRAIIACLSDAQVCEFFRVDHTYYHYFNKRWTRNAIMNLPTQPRWRVAKVYPGCTRDSVRHCEASIRKVLVRHIPVGALAPIVLEYMDCRMPCEIRHNGDECQLDVMLESALRRAQTPSATVTTLHGIPCTDPLLRVAWAFKYGFQYPGTSESSHKRKRVDDAVGGDDAGADANANANATNTDALMRADAMIDNLKRIAKTLLVYEPRLDFRCIDYIRRRVWHIADWALWPEWRERVWTTAEYEYLLRPETHCRTLFERIRPSKTAAAAVAPTASVTAHPSASFRPYAPDHILHDRARALYIGASGFDFMTDYLDTLYFCGDYRALRKFARKSLVPLVREYERAGGGVVGIPAWWETLHGEIFQYLTDVAELLPGAVGLREGIRNRTVFKALVERMESMKTVYHSPL